MNNYNLGKNFLITGCFLLPTSGYIGPFFILLACVCGSSLQGFKALLVKKMYPLYLLAVLMLISAFTSPFGLRSCVGIFNWLPFFWLFWSLSIYFQDRANLKRVALSLVYGTIPVLIIGFSKLVFGLSESPRIFGSFIVWHMIDNSEFTGVFYNRNICAAWLAASFPLFAAVVRSKNHFMEDKFKDLIASFALFSISLAMIMSNSRNAIGALVFGSLVMFADFFSVNQSIGGLRFSRFGFALLVFAIVFTLCAYFGLVHPFLDALSQSFADDDRLEIWRFGVQIASENFLVGSGSGGFSGYVSLLSPFDGLLNYHVHSLPLDLWISYGFIAMVVFLLYVFTLLFKAMRSGVWQKCIFNKAWLVSFLLLMIVSATDLPYLDARINLVGWILFAGIVSWTESSVLISAGNSFSDFD